MHARIYIGLKIKKRMYLTKYKGNVDRITKNLKKN